MSRAFFSDIAEPDEVVHYSFEMDLLPEGATPSMLDMVDSRRASLARQAARLRANRQMGKLTPPSSPRDDSAYSDSSSLSSADPLCDLKLEGLAGLDPPLELWAAEVSPSSSASSSPTAAADPGKAFVSVCHVAVLAQVRKCGRALGMDANHGALRGPSLPLPDALQGGREELQKYITNTEALVAGISELKTADRKTAALRTAPVTVTHDAAGAELCL